MICIFFPCKWIHILNTHEHGLYQCKRCKEISKGVRRYKNGDVMPLKEYTLRLIKESDGEFSSVWSRLIFHEYNEARLERKWIMDNFKYDDVQIVEL